MKRFSEWIGLKEKLHGTIHLPPLVSRGDIWWASVGENIGSEINGKSTLFSRPVVIVKKFSHRFFFVVPTTTQVREGTWYVRFRHRDREMAACLHQGRALDYRRLSSKFGTVDDTDYLKIRDGIRNLYLSE